MNWSIIRRFVVIALSTAIAPLVSTGAAGQNSASQPGAGVARDGGTYLPRGLGRFADQMGTSISIGGGYAHIDAPSVSTNAGLNSPVTGSDIRFGPKISRADGFTINGLLELPIEPFLNRLNGLGPARTTDLRDLDFRRIQSPRTATLFATFDYTRTEASGSASHPIGDQNTFVSGLFPEPGRTGLVNPIFNLSPGQVGLVITLDRDIDMARFRSGLASRAIPLPLLGPGSYWRWKAGFEFMYLRQDISSRVAFPALANSYSITNIELLDYYLGPTFGGRIEIPLNGVGDTPPYTGTVVPSVFIEANFGPGVRFSDRSAAQESRCGDPANAACALAYTTAPIVQRISDNGTEFTFIIGAQGGFNVPLSPNSSLGLEGGVLHIGDVSQFNAPGPAAGQNASFGSDSVTVWNVIGRWTRQFYP